MKHCEIVNKFTTLFKEFDYDKCIIQWKNEEGNWITFKDGNYHCY